MPLSLADFLPFSKAIDWTFWGKIFWSKIRPYLKEKEFNYLLKAVQRVSCRI